ncbi:mucin-5AC isoform X3 [Biomphalaria pfeifferi]|uniref:Mucin-5AC isoform X3 n=1 Tax=Biomphalaria pfeifferi TaxID=112525 RepID=A0AAD8C6U3_BIOPF|nr:mucin-5AC isoform X3 [Biomphalaria pfeifferi]
MNKIKTSGGGERKGECGGEGEASHMISTSAATSGLLARPSFPLQPAPGQTYIVQPHHEMKNFGKSTRPIAPAPPAQTVQMISARNVPASQVNIPNIISPSLCQPNPNTEGILNLVTTTASGSIGSVNHSTITVPVTSVLQLGSNTLPGGSTVVQQGISGPSIPISMLGNARANQQPQNQNQAFTPNFSSLARGPAALAVPKSTAVLRQASTPALQIPTPPLSLPLARAPIHQAIKTTTAPATRSQSPAVVGQPVLQAQPQDLSRASLPIHGSITPVVPGSHPMHITLNRMVAPLNTDAVNQTRTISAQVQSDSPSNLQQRISVSLSSDSNLHTRMGTDLSRSISFVSQTKNNNPSLVPQAKIISSQNQVQQGTSIKSVNLAVSAVNPVMINSLNTSQTNSSTTIASTSASIPIAKVTPQRLHNVGSILTSSQLPVHIPSTASVLSSMSASQTNTVTFSSSTLPLSSAHSSELEAGHHDQPGHSNTGAIIVTPDYQARTPGSIITLPSSIGTAATANVLSQAAENRSNSHIQPQQMNLRPPTDQMWYQNCLYSPIVRQATNFFLPNQGTKIPTQTPTLAASQLAAMSSNVRFNSGTMMIDPSRFPQHALHSTFNASTNTGGVSTDKINNTARVTLASSIYTNSVGVQSQIQGAGGGGGGNSGSMSSSLSAVPVSNPSSSPRPSILRKRTTNEAVVVRKPNFNLNQEPRCHSPPRVDTNTSGLSSPKMSIKNFSPLSENSQSSTDTALSSNDATTPTHNHNEKGKVEGEDCVENGPPPLTSMLNNIPASPAVSHTGSLSEASPRKRARKQLLHANEELKDNNSSSDDEIENARQREESVRDQKEKEKEIRGEYTDEEGVRWVLNKPKPTFVLLQPEFVNNKTRNNHFMRYSDVKSKEERCPTVHELSNQRGITQKVNGWKLFFTASQLEELMDIEKDIQVEFCEVQTTLSQIHNMTEEEAGKIHEMSQANIQRCQLIQNQLTDARASMIRTLEHKPRIQEIVNKHISKRPIKKKERT